jgi:4-hydroxy-3-polyprenylbenzoate decarboxylase
VRGTWSGALDPRKRVGDNLNSRALVDACRPFEWIDEFPHVAESSPELMEATIDKWGHLLDD